ncbi:uncharacterized protein [Trachinotus anak]|uniref:uncharacterized protein n=1 Tax=Trachinotus anak TaxID=443729 RepID=UPI0039F1E466
MVHWQLSSLDQLMTSGFGRPFPRHGLQLLYWFSNQCVTCDIFDFVVIMKLVSDCQPERGLYGFHLFANMEELLPVQSRHRRRNRQRQLLYYEVGNLNTDKYPESANLPMYVRENYGLDGNRGINNIDRLIISYQVRTMVVETVYVTQHDSAAFGRFCPEGTYEISSELIQALQSPQLDLTTFLTMMGYYGDIQGVQDMEELHYPEASAQTVQTYSGFTAGPGSDDLRFLSEAFNQQLDINISFSYDQQVHNTVSVTSYNPGPVANYSEVQRKHRRPKANKRHRALRQSDWMYGWEQAYTAFDKDARKRNGGGGGGVSLVKILLGAVALYVTAKCFRWLRSWWKEENILKMIPWKTPSYQHTHVMLDYVY